MVFEDFYNNFIDLKVKNATNVSGLYSECTLTGLRGVHRKLSSSTDPTHLGMSQWFPPIFRLGQFFLKLLDLFLQ